MNKYFVRLLVAFIAFGLSVVLTNISKRLRGYHSCVEAYTVAEPLAFAEDEGQIREIYSEYGPAQTRHDRAFFERVETDDFILVGNWQLTREQDIRWMESQPTDITYELKLDHLRIFGDSAISHGRMQIRYSNGDVSEWPFTDVWIKRNGVWRIQRTTATH